MSRRPAADTGMRRSGDGSGRAPAAAKAVENSERTPLLSGTLSANRRGGMGDVYQGGGVNDDGGDGDDGDGDGDEDDESPLLPPSSSMAAPSIDREERKRRRFSSSLKDVDTYTGDGLRARTITAAWRTRLWLDRFRDRGDDLNVYSLASLGIIMSYFSVGVALELLYTPVAYYLIDDLGAESGIYTVWYILITLPWSFKVAYGFLSDCVPICGLRRKPYMLIGWTVHIMCNCTLAIMVTPGADAVVTLSFLAACGYLLSDVMTDAIVVERTQRESMSSMGNIQASGYIARYFGSCIGAIGGAVLYNTDTWGWGLSISTLFWIQGLVPLILVIPLMPFLLEDKKPRETNVLKRHCDEIWALVRKKAVWRPMIFVYVYNALMLPNSAWTNYLIETLGFSDWDIGVVNICSQVFAWLGLIVYKRYMVDISWPALYFYTTFLSFLASIMQLLLILGISTSWGIPNLLFASGDEAVSNIVLALQFLPFARMYAVMCPSGSEGTSYALLTTMSNVAYAVAYAVGDLLTDLGGVWSTSNATLLAGDMSGMWRLTLLTSCIALAPISLVWLLPRNKKEQLELQKSSDASTVGGKLFLWVAGLSILFSIVEAFVELCYS